MRRARNKQQSGKRRSLKILLRGTLHISRQVFSSPTKEVGTHQEAWHRPNFIIAIYAMPNEELLDVHILMIYMPPFLTVDYLLRSAMCTKRGNAFLLTTVQKSVYGKVPIYYQSSRMRSSTSSQRVPGQRMLFSSLLHTFHCAEPFESRVNSVDDVSGNYDSTSNRILLRVSSLVISLLRRS